MVTISFGAEMWVKVWQEETQAPFPLLLDQERVAYQAYGLERSMWQAWGPRNIWYYVKAVLGGRKMISSHGDDTGQMGGDFIIDAEGVLRYAHPSHNPTDRPLVSELLGVLADLST